MGGPAAITRLIIPVAAGVITALLASIGTEAVVGFGATVKNLSEKFTPKNCNPFPDYDTVPLFENNFSLILTAASHYTP